MKFHWFAEVTYPHLPEDFPKRFRSAWVDPPPSLMDPQKVGETYRMFIRLMEQADRDAAAVLLSQTELRQICRLLVDVVNQALIHRNVQISIDDSVVDWLMKKAEEEANSGARPLRRAIQRHIEDELSEYMIRHKESVPERIEFSMNGDEVVLIATPKDELIAN